MSDPTRVQMSMIIAGIKASVDPDIVGALMARDWKTMVDWLNHAGTTKAWRPSVDKRDLFEAMNLSTYDSVSSGKKDSWQLMLAMAPLDMTRGGMRKGVLDIFVAADANAMLDNFTEKASRAEEFVGGSSPTTGTVTALKRDWAGTITIDALKGAMRP